MKAKIYLVYFIMFLLCYNSSAFGIDYLIDDYHPNINPISDLADERPDLAEYDSVICGKIDETYHCSIGCGDVGNFEKVQNQNYMRLKFEPHDGCVVDYALVDGNSIGAVNFYDLPLKENGYTDSENWPKTIDVFFKAAGEIVYKWHEDDWSACNNICGEGIQTRNVQCIDSDGNIVSDDKCPGIKPDSKKTCFDESGCEKEVYSWQSSSWSTCSNSCGDGDQTRTVQCVDNNGNKVSDSKCSNPKPDDRQSCFDDSGCEKETYSWDADLWSSCSNTCGDGIQTRTVRCIDNNGNTVADNNCAGSKLDNNRNCYDNSGCNSSWDTNMNIFDIIISLYNNPTGDNEPDNNSGFEEQTAYEEIIRYWADGVYEQSNGMHKLGVVKIFVGGRQASMADVVWNQSAWPQAAISGFGINGLFIKFGDIFPDGCGAGCDVNMLENHEKSGYVLAHEWGHYVYGLYDEYKGDESNNQISSPQYSDIPVPDSIMNNSWNAADGNFKWLNHSTPDNYQPATAQGRCYSASGWDVLIRRPEEDPRNGERDALPHRIRYTSLVGEQPIASENWMKLELPDRQASARSNLEIQWITDISASKDRNFEASAVSLGGVNIKYPEPIILTSVVSKGNLITNINLTASIRDQSDSSTSIKMNDSGKNGDARANDGIYSAIVNYKNNGIHTVTIEADNNNIDAKFTADAFQPSSDINGNIPESFEFSPITENFFCTATTTLNISGFKKDDYPDTAPGTVINADNTDIAGRIDFAGDTDFFSINNISRNKNMIVRVTNTALGMTPILTLYKSNGATEIDSASVSDVGDSSYVHVFIPPSYIDESGTMVVSVSHSDPNAAEGVYDISVGSVIISDNKSLIKIEDNTEQNNTSEDGPGDEDSTCFISTMKDTLLFDILENIHKN